jgi:hypothetical protein
MNQPTHIRVMNGNDFLIDDRFDGILYEFLPGDQKGKLVPIMAASLFFGFALDENGNVSEAGCAPNWDYVQRRWGWNCVTRRKDEEMADAVIRTNTTAKERCAKIKLEPVVMALREVQAEESGELPPPREPRKARAKMSVGA